jgi:hypothetical protein
MGAVRKGFDLTLPYEKKFEGQVGTLLGDDIEVFDVFLLREMNED